MTIRAPSLVVSKVIQCEDGTRRIGRIAVILRDEDTSVPESDDINPSCLPQIRCEARMPIDMPSCIITIVADDESWRLKGVVSVILGDKDTVFPKPNQVRSPITRGISDETNVLFDPPSPGVVGEIVEDSFSFESLLRDLGAVQAQDQDFVEAESDNPSSPCAFG